MAETLLAIVLVTTSAKGANLVFRWPPIPAASPRLCRPKPDNQVFISQLDNPWRASLSHQSHSFASGNGNGAGVDDVDERDYARDPEYCWQRPGARSPPPESSWSRKEDPYEYMLGYSCEFLATLLCPQRSMCHQRFELVVDDLAFIGHPVCAAEELGGGGGSGSTTVKWSFKQEKVKPNSRGRDVDGKSERKTIPTGSIGHHLGTAPGYDSYHNHYPNHQQVHSHPPSNATSQAGSPEKPDRSMSVGPSPAGSPSSAWLAKFQLVLVLDLPDPSSSASGNVAKYFDIIYEQIAFTFTAVLFQEQVRENFVERECDALISLQESLLKNEQPYETFVQHALQTSSIAAAMKTVYESIKARSIAYISLNAIPLELQLPPYLDDLLHSDGDNTHDLDFIERPDDEAMQNWGPELRFGWKLPGLAPWKSLLLLEGENDLEDPFLSLRGGGAGTANLSGDEKTMAESLVRFLETANTTLSLADMGKWLDWDLEEQVYPVVRWLVLHRKAKIVDRVHSRLKTIFALPAQFSEPLPKLIEEFRIQFAHPEIPPLPNILAAISASLANKDKDQTRKKGREKINHFFASVVKKKELISMYHDVVVWMLKRDMLVTLHVRVRIVATRDLKMKVFEARERARARRAMRPRANESGQWKGKARGRGPGGRPLRRGSGVHQLEFDEFDEDEDQSAGSGSNKTPSGLTAWMSLSPQKRNMVSSLQARGRAPATNLSLGMGLGGNLRRLSSADSRKTNISELVIQEEDDGDLSEMRMNTFGDEGDVDFTPADDEKEDALVEEIAGEEDETDYMDSEPEGDDAFAASIIKDPGRATPKERRWLNAMSDNITDLAIVKRFDQINQYFDGKTSGDEILYRAEIDRQQLRVILGNYAQYLQIFLHPS